MFRVEVKNFGPIIEGEVDIKPLTIFIGPNSSGKSYLAMLIYALLRSFRQLLRPSYFYPTFVGRPVRLSTGLSFREQFKANEQVRQSLGEWLQEQAPSEGKLQLHLETLPEDVKDFLGKAITDLIVSSADNLTSEVKRCYRAGISELVRQENPTGALSLSVRQEKSGLALHFSSANDNLKLASPQFQLPEKPLDLDTKQFPFRFIRNVRGKQQTTLASALGEVLVDIMGSQISREVFQDLLSDICYLPAARSGILQSHRALASFTMARSPLIGIEPWVDIPQFTGVIADFIGSLLNIERRGKTKLNLMADLLEKEVIHGRILLEEEKHLYPEIFYQADGVERLPLHRTSSGISELAPLIIFLRHVVEPGDILIIEEPEAHLHPAAQRKLAKVLVRLVRANTKVLITTHSDYLVQQLSNLVSRSQIPARAKAKQEGYGKEDYLTPEEVGAYLFKLDEDRNGSTIEPLKVDREGIDEDDFDKVARELYDEMVYLHRKLPV